MSVAVRQGGRLQRPGQWRFGVDERDKGWLNFCRAKGAKAAKSRSDAMTIARRFNAGFVVKYNSKSRRDDRGFQNEIHWQTRKRCVMRSAVPVGLWPMQAMTRR